MLKFGICYRCLQITVMLMAASCISFVARASNVDLDSSTRRSILEAKMMKYGKNNTQVQSKGMDRNLPNAVEIDNKRGGRRLKVTGSECAVKVGNVIQNTRMKGTYQQNVTVIEGSVINVCQ